MLALWPLRGTTPRCPGTTARQVGVIPEGLVPGQLPRRRITATACEKSDSAAGWLATHRLAAWRPLVARSLRLVLSFRLLLAAVWRRRSIASRECRWCATLFGALVVPVVGRRQAAGAAGEGDGLFGLERRSTSSTSAATGGSSAEVISSQGSSRGFIIRARAIATRCRSPPENWVDRLRMCCDRSPAWAAEREGSGTSGILSGATTRAMRFRWATVRSIRVGSSPVSRAPGPTCDEVMSSGQR